MTAKGEPVCHPEREIDSDKEKITPSTSKHDHDFLTLQAIGNISESLQTKVIATSRFNRTENQVIRIGNTKSFWEEKPLVTAYADKDNGLSLFKETRITFAIVDSNRKSSYHAKLSGECRKDIIISKRLRHRKKTEAANRKPFVFLHTLSMACMIISIIKAETVVCTDIVKWEVKTKPILFGETLELLCKILDEEKVCQGSFQQWYGSTEDILLCQNGKCRNEEKYTVKRNANCSYSLLIHNLSIHDVDITYSCTYGINEMKKGLMMKDYNFFKLPRNNSSDLLLNKNNSFVDVLLRIDGIYPEPNCTITLHERDITRNANISSTVIQDGTFFTYNMHIVHNLSQMDCGSLLLVHCVIGSFVVTDFAKKLDKCTNLGSNLWSGNLTFLVSMTVIIPSVMTIFIVCSVLHYRKRKGSHISHLKGRKKITKTKEEDTSTRVPLQTKSSIDMEMISIHDT